MVGVATVLPMILWIFCIWPLFCCAVHLLSVVSSFAIISLGKRAGCFT